MKKKFKSIICIVLSLITIVMMSSVAYAYPSMRPDAPPSLHVTEVDYTSVKLEWSDHNDSTYQYLVYRSPSGKAGTWTKLTTTKAGARSYTDKTVVPNKVYYYTVKSYYYSPSSKLKLVSQMSTVWKVSTEIYRPVFNLVGNGGNGVVLKWDIDKEMNGVAIYKSLTGKAGSWTKIKVIKNNKTKTYTDSNVKIGETYYYCYKVYKTIGGKDYYSTASKAYKSTILDVSVPQNLKAVPIDSGVRLTYSKSLGTIGYMIYRSDTGKAGTWKKIATTKSNNTLEYIDKTAVEGKTYYYTIKSYKKVSGEFFYSASAKGIKVVNDVAPAELSFDPQDSVTFTNYYEEIPVTLKFKNVNEADKFKIYIDEFEVSDIDNFTDAQYEDFLSECKFMFDIDEEKTTDSELALILYRVAPGTGTLKFAYKNAEAVLSVNCGEFEYDKDATEIAKNYAEAIEYAYEAGLILEEALESQKSVLAVEKGVKAREVLAKAVPCLENAKTLLEAHREEFTGMKRFHDEINEIGEALKLISYAHSSLEAIEDAPEPLLLCEDSLDYLIEYFEKFE